MNVNVVNSTLIKDDLMNPDDLTAFLNSVDLRLSGIDMSSMENRNDVEKLGEILAQIITQFGGKSLFMDETVLEIDVTEEDIENNKNVLRLIQPPIQKQDIDRFIIKVIQES